MIDHKTTSNQNSSDSKCNLIPWPEQIRVVKAFLEKSKATNKMVSEATGIDRANLCRIKRKLEDQGQLIEHHKGLCKVTGFRAAYLTTNKCLIEKSSV